MTLKLTKGISSLSLLPLRVRIVAGVLILLCVSATFVSESGTVRTKPEIHEAAQQANTVTKEAASVSVDSGRAVSGADASAASSSVVKTAKIVTCPRCRLNALPLVKKFVYEHAKLFEPGLKIDFIAGEDPTLFLYEDGKEVQEIDLEEYDWKKIIVKLVDFGIPPTEETDEVKQALAGH